MVILEQAGQLFARRGFSGVSMGEIAQACDVAKAALYHHFRDKNDLYMHVLMQGIDSLRRDLLTAMQHRAPIGDRLLLLGQRLADNPHADFRRIQNVLSEYYSPEEQHRAYAILRSSFIAPLTEVFAQGISRGEFRAGNSELRVFAFLGAICTLAAWPHCMPGAPARAEMIEEAVGLFLPNGSQ